jgi:hypothetical protein
MIVRKRGPAILDDAGTVVEMSREGKGYHRRNDRAERGRFPAQVSDRSQSGASRLPDTRTQARSLVVEVPHGVLGELLELGAQSCAFCDEPRNGAVRRRQEGAGEAGDCCLENRLWMSGRPTVRIVLT